MNMNLAPLPRRLILVAASGRRGKWIVRPVPDYPFQKRSDWRPRWSPPPERQREQARRDLRERLRTTKAIRDAMLFNAKMILREAA
jgi:hypothetical protein